MRTTRAIFGLLLLPLALAPARGGQLPARSYSIADGLVHDRVLCVVRDSRDFLWFCTSDGLSRFNGYDFTNYGVHEGLVHPAVLRLEEGRGGVYCSAPRRASRSSSPRGRAPRRASRPTRPRPSRRGPAGRSSPSSR